MKNIKLVIIILIIVTLGSIGCTKSVGGSTEPQNPTERCSSADSVTYLASINGFDFNTSSPYYNQAVVNFKFVQSQTTCPSLASSTNLVIKNLTNNTISFSYTIYFQLNYAKWSYQDVGIISPLSSVDVGEINTNPARIDLGYFTIQGSQIAYY